MGDEAGYGWGHLFGCLAVASAAFLFSAPFFAVRGWRRKEPLSCSLRYAMEFAGKSAVVVTYALFLLVFGIGPVYVALSWLGDLLFGEEDFAPFVIPLTLIWGVVVFRWAWYSAFRGKLNSSRKTKELQFSCCPACGQSHKKLPIYETESGSYFCEWCASRNSSQNATLIGHSEPPTLKRYFAWRLKYTPVRSAIVMTYVGIGLVISGLFLLDAWVFYLPMGEGLVALGSGAVLTAIWVLVPEVSGLFSRARKKPLTE